MPSFKCRAECPHDALEFMRTIRSLDDTAKFLIHANPLKGKDGPMWVSDVTTVVTTTQSKEKIDEILSKQVDAHVMERTLEVMDDDYTHTLNFFGMSFTTIKLKALDSEAARRFATELYYSHDLGWHKILAMEFSPNSDATCSVTLVSEYPREVIDSVLVSHNVEVVE